MTKPKLIIFSGAPGAGKSTWMCKAFAAVKNNNRKIKVEFLPEPFKIFAYKEIDRWVQEECEKLLLIQLEILAGSDLEIILTDVDPRHSYWVYNKFDNQQKIENILENFEIHNIFVERSREYQTFGRYQTEEEALALQDIIVEKTKQTGNPFRYLPNSKGLTEDQILQYLGVSHA